MADETKRVIITVDLDLATYKKELQVANSSVATLTKSQAALRKEGKESSSAYAENQLSLAKYNKEVSDLKRIINNATVANADYSGSNVQLKAALSASTYELNKLSEAEITGTNRGIQLKEQVLNLTETLKANEKAVGDNHRNVGNYADGLVGLKQQLKDAETAAVNAAKAFGLGSAQFIEASKEAGKLKDEITDIKGATKDMATGSGIGQFKNQLGSIGDSLRELDFAEAAEKAKGLSKSVGSFTWSGMISGGKALITTLGEMAAAMMALPIFWVAAGVAAVTAAVYLWAKSTQEGTQKIVDNLQKVSDRYSALYDFQLKMAKAVGADTEKIELKKMDLQKMVIDRQIAQLNYLQNTIIGLNDEQKKQLDELRKKQFDVMGDIYAKQAEINQKKIDGWKKETEKSLEHIKKFDEDHAKRQEEAADVTNKINEERAADNLKYIKIIEDQKIQMLADDEMREIAKATLDNARSLDEITKSKANNKTKQAALISQQELFESDVDSIKEKHLAIRQTAFDKAVEDQIKSDKPRIEKAIKAEEEIDNEVGNIINKGLERALATNEEEIKLAKEKAEAIKKIEAAAFATTSTAVNSIFEIQNNNRNAEITGIENEAKAKIDAIQKQADTGIITQQEFETKSNRIKADSAAKEAAIKKKQFESGKKLALINIAIKTAEAIINAFTGPPLAAPALAAAAVITGALEANVVASQEAPAFAYGGKTLSGKKITSSDGRRIYRANGDNLLATVRTNEVILNEGQQRALGGAATFRSIGVPGFASGGATSDGGILANRLSSNVDNYISAVNAQTRLNKTLPRPVVLVQDISESLGNNAKVIDKGNL